MNEIRPGALSVSPLRQSWVYRLAGLMLLGVLMMGACTPVAPPVAPGAQVASPSSTPDLGRPEPTISTESHAFVEPSRACEDRFVAHELDHVTTTADGVIRMFEANGAGVGVGDLDNDGDLDMVLGNYDGPDSIFWNEGDLHFRKETLPVDRTRAVTLVDVDADGWLDIVLTRVNGAINYLRNRGNAEGELANPFQLEFLPGFATPAYVIDWADLDGDGDLDAVTASYDAGLLTDQGNSFLLEGGGGVVFYEKQASGFVPHVLAQEAQALAITLFDVNADEHPDIVIGNDFDVRDQVWLRQDDGWMATEPFARTSHSTMSLDQGDVNNDGVLELFSTDMKPYSDDPEYMAAWAPMMAGMDEQPMPEDTMHDDPQVMENVLQMSDGQGEFQDQAAERGIDATGWSWSGLFGDLNSDGFLDLYVVNGFIEERVFGELPGHELVEENQAFRNTGAGDFEPAPEWGLNLTQSGRGMSMADLDGDGDLDIVVNNLRAPAVVLENRLCGGDKLAVELRWPGSENTNAVGAAVFLETDRGVLRRDVRVSRGYLSSGPSRLHFGVPADATIGSLRIRWPDGAESVLPAPDTNQMLVVERR
jgi:hypothetical protein